jgi:hypothetical protein
MQRFDRVEQCRAIGRVDAEKQANRNPEATLRIPGIPSSAGADKRNPQQPAPISSFSSTREF